MDQVKICSANIISMRNNIKKVIFKGSCFYIIWDDNSASKYQYNWIGNFEDSKFIEEMDKNVLYSKTT